MRSCILSSAAMAMLGVGLVIPPPVSVGGLPSYRAPSAPRRSGGKPQPAGSKLARRAAAGTVGLARLR